MFENDDRLRKVRIQLILQISEGCSQGTVYNSLRQKLEASFDRVPIFQVYFNGLGSNYGPMAIGCQTGYIYHKSVSNEDSLNDPAGL